MVASRRLSVSGLPCWVRSTNSGSTNEPTAVFNPNCLPKNRSPSRNSGMFNAHWVNAGWKPNRCSVIMDIPVTPPEAT
ncbi:hypothetical protein D3C73_1297160 [compost metagenome]